MSKQVEQNLKPLKNEIPKYGLLYFDHLQGEYVIERDSMSEKDRKICSDIQSKRDDNTLNWDDVYAFQLVLLKYQDYETLKSKIISLRLKYQNLVDTAEYNGYMALRAVDLTKPVRSADIEKLQSDCKYLLDEFYLRYAYVSSREDLRTKLIRRSAILTSIFFIITAVITVISLSYYANTKLFPDIIAPYISVFSTLMNVIIAGMLGAFVSMQQRLQTVSNQGDPIYNLSLLTHGWLSIFLSPISGAIFAVILYFFFAGGLLKGEIFPTILTTKKPETITIGLGEAKENTSSNEQKEDTLSGESQNDSTDSQNNPSDNTQDTNKQTIVVRPSGLMDLLSQTGAATSKDFALLIIWAFIAGFAERLVPDTLRRLVDQKKPNESSSG